MSAQPVPRPRLLVSPGAVVWSARGVHEPVRDAATHVAVLGGLPGERGAKPCRPGLLSPAGAGAGFFCYEPAAPALAAVSPLGGARPGRRPAGPGCPVL